MNQVVIKQAPSLLIVAGHHTQLILSAERPGPGRPERGKNYEGKKNKGKKNS